MKWLAQGGALGIFPAGTVSHLHVRKGCIADPAWHRTVAVLARRTGATVITMFFEGHNSLAFELSGLIHPRLRTALLPSEFLKRSRSRVSVRIGRPIEPHKIARYPDDRALTEYLRFKTYMLQWRESAIRPRFAPSEPAVQDEPLRPPQPSRGLKDEVMALPATALLAEQADYQVFMASRHEIPSLLIENRPPARADLPGCPRGNRPALRFGRLRPALPAPLSLEHRPPRSRGQLSSGPGRPFLPRKGGAGLYSSTLFKFKPGFLERLGPPWNSGALSCGSSPRARRRRWRFFGGHW